MVLILVVAAVVVVDAANVSLMPIGSKKKVYSLRCVVCSVGGHIRCEQSLSMQQCQYHVTLRHK
jgi:hypothetical protein